jgi:hypothetical protein
LNRVLAIRCSHIPIGGSPIDRRARFVLFKARSGSQAKFFYPFGLAITKSGTLIVLDEGNYAIRLINPAGVVSTLAGNGNAGSASLCDFLVEENFDVGVFGFGF